MEGTDFVVYKSVTISDVAASNGGRMSTTQATSGVLNNLFPNVTQSERTDGVTRYRKFFFKNKNASNETAATSRIWISQRSTGGDYFRLKGGTNADVQTDAEGYTNWSGTGYLSTTLAADSTSMDVIFDAASGVYAGSVIRVSDSSGIEEFLTVKAAGVSWFGNIAMVVTTTAARNTYPSGQNSLVCAVIDLGSLAASQDSWSESSASGTYDESTYPPLVNNVGTVEDTWTITFTSASAFTCAGTQTGSVGAGSILSDFSPINPNVGTGDYYFSVRSAGWGGTWQTGETVTFSTHHSAGAFWVKEIIPASTAAKTNNQVIFTLYAEGA